MSSGPDWVDWVGLLGYREDLILFLSGCLQCFSQQRQWNQGITFIWDPVHLVPTRILKKKESQSSHKTQQSGKAARYCQQKLRVIWYKHWARNGTLFPSSHLRILIMRLFHTPENKAGAGKLFQQLSAKPGLLPLPWRRDLSGSLRIRELVCWQDTSVLKIFSLDFCSEMSFHCKNPNS